jgi:Ala-tRNA(Pro) deacylase
MRQEVGHAMTTTTSLERPSQRLLDWLADHDIDHEVHPHDRTVRAPATAAAEGIDPRTFAKVVAVDLGDGRSVLLVLEATDRLDLDRARAATAAPHPVRLLDEAELARLAPDCEVGAMPAVGALYGVPTFADHRLREDPEISFNAGSHRFAVRVDRPAWERACSVVYADLAADRDAGPAWAR